MFAGKEVEDVKAVQASTLSRLHQLKRKHLELTHRVLQVHRFTLKNIQLLCVN